MGRKEANTTEAERKIILHMYNEGKSCGEIGQALNRSRFTIYSIIKRSKGEINLQRRCLTGRPRKLSLSDEGHIIRQIKENPQITTTEVVAKLFEEINKKVHPKTVLRVMRRAGYRSRIARREARISKVNEYKGIEFTKEYKNKPSNAIFSDILQSDGRSRVWRKPNSEFDKSDTKDPIEVYDMLLSDRTSQDSVKQNDAFNKRLIRHVRRHRILYDPAYENFSSVEAKLVVWEKIAKQMRCDADVCRNAWINLRYCYQKYVRRLRKFFANKRGDKRLHRPAMAFETEMLFLWRFISDKASCPLPYNEKKVEKEEPPAEHIVEDDDIVVLEDDVEVIDLDDDATNIARPFTKQFKTQFQITPEIRRLLASIEPYEELYDSYHRYYQDYRRKGIIWNAIANEVGDKATKLMKCWIQIQTRYEWEIMQRLLYSDESATRPETELESLMTFFKPHILKMPNTVYKSSYFLKQAWHEPIDHFKNIFSLLVAMKKYPAVISLTETVTKGFASNNGVAVSANYATIWGDVATAKGGSVTPGQCEATWIILRTFYWELVNMRKHSYQLQDKWYFETIISELYALAKAQKMLRTKSKQNVGTHILSSICADESPTPSPPLPPPASEPTSNTNQLINQKPISQSKVVTITLGAPAASVAPVLPVAPALSVAPALPAPPVLPASPVFPAPPVFPALPVLPVAPALPVAPVTSLASVMPINRIMDTIPAPIPPPMPSTIVPIPVNFDEDKISCSKIETKSKQFENIIPTATTTTTPTTTTLPSSNLLVTLRTARPMARTKTTQLDSQPSYPQSNSPQIRVKSHAELHAESPPVKMFVSERPQLPIQAQNSASTKLAVPQISQLQLRLQTPPKVPNPLQTITLPCIPHPQQAQFQMLPLTPIQAQSKAASKAQSNMQTQSQIIPTNMGQLLPPVAIEPPCAQNQTLPLDTIKTPKIVSAVSLAPRASFSAPFTNKGLQITAVASGNSATPPPPPPPLLPMRATAPTVPVSAAPTSSRPPLPTLEPLSRALGTAGILNLPFPLPDNTNIVKCPPPLNMLNSNPITAVAPVPNMNAIAPLPTVQRPTGTANTKATANAQPTASRPSLEPAIPTTVLPRPRIIPASQLNANEIMIELISSVNGNQLVVHGPPLEQRYSLPMSTTALLIREVLSIPYLHKKDYNKPAQVHMCWLYLAKRFNLPVHICKACWNFLSENFTHFPQIAPIEELTKPVKVGIKVWRESAVYFQTFNEKAAQLRLPNIKNAVEKFFDNIRDQTENIPRIPGKKLTFAVDWQEAARQTNARVSNKLWFATWNLFRSAFAKFMRDLEVGVVNYWCLEWWRVLAKLDFFIEELYHNMEPFYYIIRNKMFAECERCIREEQKLNAGLLKMETVQPLLQTIPDIDSYRVIQAVRRYPQIYQKATEDEKNNAWEQVAMELQTSVTSCRFAFQYALKNYRLYAARDPANRCRLNHRYYKHMSEIYRAIKPIKKLNIKTPSELNQSVGEGIESNEPVFPERFIMDINMSNSSSNVVMKNWGYGLNANVPTEKLKELFDKYRSTAVPAAGSCSEQQVKKSEPETVYV